MGCAAGDMNEKGNCSCPVAARTSDRLIVVSCADYDAVTSTYLCSTFPVSQSLLPFSCLSFPLFLVVGCSVKCRLWGPRAFLRIFDLMVGYVSQLRGRVNGLR